MCSHFFVAYLHTKSFENFGYNDRLALRDCLPKLPSGAATCEQDFGRRQLGRQIEKMQCLEKFTPVAPGNSFQTCCQCAISAQLYPGQIQVIGLLNVWRVLY